LLKTHNIIFYHTATLGDRKSWCWASCVVFFSFTIRCWILEWLYLQPWWSGKAWWL